MRQADKGGTVKVVHHREGQPTELGFIIVKVSFVARFILRGSIRVPFGLQDFVPRGVRNMLGDFLSQLSLDQVLMSVVMLEVPYFLSLI